MQAVMLAAGKGTRLGKYTKNNTKCILEVNGKTLLERTIDSLVKADIKDFILVLGYKKENVKKYIREKKLDKKINIIYVYNADYNTTNNIYSLYLAKDYLLKDDTILLESDIIYDEKIIKSLIESDYDNAVVVAKYEKWMDGTVTILDNEDNILEFIEKKDFAFCDIENYYKTVNIYKFSKEYLATYYLPFLSAYIESYGNNDYYELVLKVISSIQKSSLKAFKLTNQKWYEIDDCQDLDIAQLLFSTEEEQLMLYQNRYGGYWRFEGLKDFCYLVNPYFPKQNMIEKMKYSFEDLIRSYPSGLNIQKNCFSRFFNVDENNILVGNGASELINLLRFVIKGKIGIIVPTFNEYVRCFPNSEIIEINTKENNYQITKKKLLSYIDLVDNLIIINPDNPSGYFINREDMLEVIESYNKKGKYIIFDESFIDFVNSDERYTLLEDSILNKYKNLIVVKSISKSYGIAGLRLGVLCSSNKILLKTIQNNMPIWNINSFAEYFLQIFIPYKKEYLESCDKMVEERMFLYENLKNIKYLNPYYSEANYIMCELKNNIKSQKLCVFLIKKYNILIKDLSSKKGFDGIQMIRIAVKNRQDNEFLIKALKEYEDVK